MGEEELCWLSPCPTASSEVTLGSFSTLRILTEFARIESQPAWGWHPGLGVREETFPGKDLSNSELKSKQTRTFLKPKESEEICVCAHTFVWPVRLGYLVCASEPVSVIYCKGPLGFSLETKLHNPDLVQLRQDPGIWIYVKHLGWFFRRMCYVPCHFKEQVDSKNGQLYESQFVYNISLCLSVCLSVFLLMIRTFQYAPMYANLWISKKLGPSHFSHKLTGFFFFFFWALIGRGGGGARTAAWCNRHPPFPLATSEQVWKSWIIPPDYVWHFPTDCFRGQSVLWKI